MSEDTGFPAPPWATNPPSAPAPVPAPTAPAEPRPAGDTGVVPGAAEDGTDRLEHDVEEVASGAVDVAEVAAPLIPGAEAIGQPLHDFLADVHRRLSNLEK